MALFPLTKQAGCLAVPSIRLALWWQLLVQPESKDNRDSYCKTNAGKGCMVRKWKQFKNSEQCNYFEPVGLVWFEHCPIAGICDIFFAVQRNITL